jgi:hypothetical protein
MAIDLAERQQEFIAKTIVTSINCLTPGCVGYMESDGMSRIPRGTSITEWRHKCSACESYEWLPKQFPLVRYQP